MRLLAIRVALGRLGGFEPAGRYTNPFTMACRTALVRSVTPSFEKMLEI
jgi:hypothetical protein